MAYDTNQNLVIYQSFLKDLIRTLNLIQEVPCINLCFATLVSLDRALPQFRARRVLSLYKIYDKSALLVLNGTLLKSVNALLALNWWLHLCCIIPWLLTTNLALNNRIWQCASTDGHSFCALGQECLFSRVTQKSSCFFLRKNVSAFLYLCLCARRILSFLITNVLYLLCWLTLLVSFALLHS